MKRILFAAAVLLGACSSGTPEHERSTLQNDPEGWTDLQPGPGLHGWTRTPLPPNGKLAGRNPWSVDPDTGTLRCDGGNGNEMLLHRTTWEDGVFHVEWRFLGEEEGKGGVYVRTSVDGSVRLRAEIAPRSERPRLGDLSGIIPQGGIPKRLQLLSSFPNRAKPAGTWNTLEIACIRKIVTLWVNGMVTATWTGCEVLRGRVGLEAGSPAIEFRNLKFKPK
jgi:hypothetical protein